MQKNTTIGLIVVTLIVGLFAGYQIGDNRRFGHRWDKDGMKEGRHMMADGKMMNQDVRRVALLDQVAIVTGLILQARIGGLNEDVRFEAGRAQHALNAEHFVADGVAIPERGQHLVNFLLLQFSTGPDGRSARTSFAGRRSLRRLANQPGSGSMPLPRNP